MGRCSSQKIGKSEGCARINQGAEEHQREEGARTTQGGEDFHREGGARTTQGGEVMMDIKPAIMLAGPLSRAYELECLKSQLTLDIACPTTASRSPISHPRVLRTSFVSRP